MGGLERRIDAPGEVELFHGEWKILRREIKKAEMIVGSGAMRIHPDRFFQLLARLVERRDLTQCDTKLQPGVGVRRILFCQFPVLNGCR